MSDGSVPPERSHKKLWQGPPTAAGTIQPGGSRRKKIVRLIAALLALGAVLIGLLRWFGPPTTNDVLSFPIREYDYLLYPPNPFAHQDGQAIVRCFDEKAELGYPSQS